MRLYGAGFFTPASFPSLPLAEIGFDFKCHISPYKLRACVLLVSRVEDSTELLVLFIVVEQGPSPKLIHWNQLPVPEDKAK